MDDAMVNFPIPIRANTVAQIKVPTDLTQAEGEKICRVVMALTVASPEEKETGGKAFLR